MYTMDDLKKATEQQELWDKKFASDRSNNPNKYQAQRRKAGDLVRRITKSLKEQGLIEKNEIELINDELDKIHPNAKSKTIVNHNGKKYQIRYFPTVKSRSGKTVKEWEHSWDEL